MFGTKGAIAIQDFVYLGFRITIEGVLPDEGKVLAIRDYPIPKNVTDVHSFLELASYYQCFVLNFARLAQPLATLLKKEVQFEWTSDCDLAFCALKAQLTNPPILHHPDFDLPFILYTDWCQSRIGAILPQSIFGKEHVIAYASRVLHPNEMNYSVNEGECLAAL